jgi:hypothetical protein
MHLQLGPLLLLHQVLPQQLSLLHHQRRLQLMRVLVVPLTTALQALHLLHQQLAVLQLLTTQ